MSKIFPISACFGPPSTETDLCADIKQFDLIKKQNLFILLNDQRFRVRTIFLIFSVFFILQPKNSLLWVNTMSILCDGTQHIDWYKTVFILLLGTWSIKCSLNSPGRILYGEKYHNYGMLWSNATQLKTHHIKLTLDGRFHQHTRNAKSSGKS